jgi:arginine/lysine/ornithine decarboxylase
MKALCRMKPASFHVPGHKSGRIADEEARRFLQQVMRIDFTELTGLDDLHHPEGVIKEAEELAARCFGAEQTFFLVGGSTVGNLALLLSLCGRDDIVIAERSVHKSVIHGLMLAGAKAVFLPSRIDERTGLAGGVRLEDVKTALHRYPQAKGVFLTNPNYYGMGVDLAPIAALLHAHGKPLLIDEAHGAHFGFHPELPLSALQQGADAVVQSTHKMLTALTMGAMLHVQGHLLPRENIAAALSMLQTSSPSYPIMASLDISRREMAVAGRRRLEAGLRAVRVFERQMERLPRFAVFTGQTSSAYETKDPFKVLVRDESGQLSGYELHKQLERRGCMVEMSEPRHVLLVFSLASTEEDALRLFQAFRQISAELPDEKQEQREMKANTLIPIPHLREISPPIAFSLPFQSNINESLTVELKSACHAKSAEMVIPYPPGIPILYPGETITPEVVEYLRLLAVQGARFQGVRDSSLRTVRIWK